MFTMVRLFGFAQEPLPIDCSTLACRATLTATETLPFILLLRIDKLVL